MKRVAQTPQTSAAARDGQSELQRSEPERAGRRSRIAWLLVAGFVCVCLALLHGRSGAPGPLGMGLGVAMPGELLGRANEPFTLSDGSRIFLPAGSRLMVLRNDGQAFVLGLRAGQGTFDVPPGGRRRWTIETGLASVEAVGTRVSVTRGEGSVTVRVERGAALVRGATLAGGVQRLTAGDSVILSAAAPAPTPG